MKKKKHSLKTKFVSFENTKIYTLQLERNYVWIYTDCNDSSFVLFLLLLLLLMLIGVRCFVLCFDLFVAHKCIQMINQPLARNNRVSNSKKKQQYSSKNMNLLLYDVIVAAWLVVVAVATYTHTHTQKILHIHYSFTLYCKASPLYTTFKHLAKRPKLIDRKQTKPI